MKLYQYNCSTQEDKKEEKNCLIKLSVINHIINKITSPNGSVSTQRKVSESTHSSKHIKSAKNQDFVIWNPELSVRTTMATHLDLYGVGLTITSQLRGMS